MITYRWVRLALAAAAAVAAVAVAVRLRRRSAPSGARPAPDSARGLTPGAVQDPPPGRESAEPWPPAPILGTPTAADLARLARRPDAPEPSPRSTPRTPRPPLDEAVRRRVVRWGSTAVALGVLVFAAQALETAVFSEEPATEVTSEAVVRLCDPPEAPGGDAEPGPVHCDEGERIVDEAWSDGAGGGRGTAFVESAPPSLPPPVSNDTGAPERAEPYGAAPDRDCTPSARAPVVRRPDPRAVRAVNRQWARIERWLKANAPATYRTLAGPARARTIAVAEAQMGLRFPDDLKASLLRHNGARSSGTSAGFPFFLHTIADVRGIRDAWRSLCAIDGEDGTDPRTEWWDGRMIPIGADGLGNHLVIDSVRRDVGESDHEGSLGFTPGDVPIRSHHALLRMTADALESGGSIGYWRPVVDGGELSWEVEDA
ncbi:SMI1/KNR4 family protein [Planomonospora sp. ID82291]|uniref:SMI1/KNR4 family protein n=1 Tax=Planomonospora sp. ID82291 TaxID=2738136 RepID=UPI0018C42FD5|nr:SMI1/KNR4 family protein [Planomonospora sp. ID82291]MBG0816249.1 SMI1/KNR4 family protein [Planomonospora sp. ID82291]